MEGHSLLGWSLQLSYKEKSIQKNRMQDMACVNWRSGENSWGQGWGVSAGESARSAVMSTYCSATGSSTHSGKLETTYVTLALRDLIPSSGLCGYVHGIHST